MVKGKYEQPDKVWRKSPTKLEECKMYESATPMEEFDWNQINDHKLPLVSKKVFAQGKFEGAFKFMQEQYGAAWNERKAKLEEYRKVDPAAHHKNSK